MGTEFAPRTDVEFELVKFLQKTYGEIIIWERLVSGPAIYKIYEFLRDVKGYEEQAWLTQKLAEAKDKSAVISETAMSGLCTHLRFGNGNAGRFYGEKSQ